MEHGPSAEAAGHPAAQRCLCGEIFWTTRALEGHIHRRRNESSEDTP